MVARTVPRLTTPSVSTGRWRFRRNNFLVERIGQFLANNSFTAKLAARMRDETATDFFEWVDISSFRLMTNPLCVRLVL